MSKINTRKINNIEVNPDVNLFFSNLGMLQQVEFIADARIINNTEEIIKILPKIQEGLQNKNVTKWVPPLSQVPGDGYCVVEITPMSIVYRDYSREAKGDGPHQFKVSI